MTPLPLVAVECFADVVLWECLGRKIGRVLGIRHLRDKGRVCNAVLRDGKLLAGMVDEDPGAARPAVLKSAGVVRSLSHADLVSGHGGFVVVLKPSLEACHLKSMQQMGLESSLGKSAKEIHERLSTCQTQGKDYQTFRFEIESLWGAIGAYLHEIEALRACIPGL